MTEEPRYTDNGNGTVTDHETTLIWEQQDTWQKETRCTGWSNAPEGIWTAIQP